MAEPIAIPPAEPGFLKRRASRRAVLAGTAGLAAAGTVAAVVGVTQQASGGGGTNLPAGAEPPTPTPTPVASKVPITDPRKRAAHLLRRAGFGGTLAEVEEFAALPRDVAVNRLVDYDALDNSALDGRIASANFVLRPSEEAGQRGRVVVDMQRWWFTRMAYTARPLEERLTFTWHGILTSQLSKIGGQRSHWMVQQNETLRKHAAGKYDDLLLAISKDPAMMVYLDTVESTGEHPNENYARELNELFSMGEGNYTEQDIRESARAFTGWRVTQPQRPSRAELDKLTPEERQALNQKLLADHDPAWVLAPRQHDDGSKTFLGKTGNWGGEDIVRIIMEQPATGRFITTKLWRAFAYDDPEPEVIDRLVKTWDASGHSIREVVRAVLMSDEFFSERAYFGKVRSPIELIVGVLRALEATPANENQAYRGRDGLYAAMDQVLYEPPNVAGWPGGAAWLSSSTFFARANYLDQLFFPNGRPLQLKALAAATTPAEVVDAVAVRLVDGQLPSSSREAIVTHITGIKDPAERAATAAYLVAAGPAFQVV